MATAKKTKTTESPVTENLTSAEEIRDAELELEETLAGVPAMRQPENLRIRHKNALKKIGLRHADDLEQLQKAQEADKEIGVDLTLSLMDMAAEMDEFAESIAFDKDEYEKWAEANSDNVPVFVALLNKYVRALGE